LKAIAEYQLINDYGLSQVQSADIAPHVADAFVAHYAGDELMTDDARTFIEALMAKGEGTAEFMLGFQLYSLWTDLAPSDSELYIPFFHWHHKKPMRWLKHFRVNFR